MVRCLFCCLLVAILGFELSAANAADLTTVLEPLLTDHQGKVAVVIRHLDTGEQFVWRADKVQSTASLIKLPVMVAAYQMADAGQLDLTKSLTLAESDNGQRPSARRCCRRYDYRAEHWLGHRLFQIRGDSSQSHGTLKPTSVIIVTAAGHGTTKVNAATGVVTYTPTANYVGTDNFTYKVKDSVCCSPKL